MAFDFNFLSNTGGTSPSPILYTYFTEDSRADILVSGYFDDAFTKLKIDDLIMIVGPTITFSVKVTNASGGVTVEDESLSDRREVSNIINIYTEDDWNAIAVGGVITITQNTSIVQHNLNLQSANRFFLDDSGPERPRVEVRSSSGFMALEYTGGGTFVTGRGDFSLNRMGLVNESGTATLIDTEGGAISFIDGTIRKWTDLGTHQRGTFLARFCRFALWGAGFKLNDCNDISLSVVRPISDPVGGILFDIKNTLIDNSVIEVIGAAGVMQPTSALLRVDPGSRDSTRVNITASTLANGLLFNETGTDGTFTAVGAGNSFGATAITSVTESSGLARFNFTPGPTLFAGQQMVVSGFVTNTDYNDVLTITATGAGFFETTTVRFGSDESGSFLSNSVTLTDTTNTILEGDTVDIDTDSSTEYDGGSIAYNVLTNSFEVSRTLNGTATGSWSTKGLNQKNNKILATVNPNFQDSRALGFAKMNGNAVITSISDGVYAPVNVTGLIENGVTEGFKLIDPVAGIFEYIRNERLSKVFKASLWAAKTGNTENYRFSTSVNGAVPVFATSDYSPMEVKTTKVSVPLALPIDITKGDTFQIMGAGDGTADNLTITDLFMEG